MFLVPLFLTRCEVLKLQMIQISSHPLVVPKTSIRRYKNAATFCQALGLPPPYSIKQCANLESFVRYVLTSNTNVTQTHFYLESHILLFCFSSLPCGPCGFYLGHVKNFYVM